MTLSDYIDEVNELPVKRVKEFIKELKERLDLCEAQSLKRTNGLLHNRTIRRLKEDIDKLAGGKLVK